MATDRELLVASVKGMLASAAGTTSTGSEIDKMLKVGRAGVSFAANATHANAPILTVPTSLFSNGVKVKEFRVTPMVAITADNTNNVTFTLKKEDGAGGAQTTVCTANTAATAAGGLGSLSRGVSYAITANAQTVEVAANSVLTVHCTHAGTGANVAGALFELLFEVL